MKKLQGLKLLEASQPCGHKLHHLSHLDLLVNTQQHPDHLQLGPTSNTLRMVSPEWQGQQPGGDSTRITTMSDLADHLLPPRLTALRISRLSRPNKHGQPRPVRCAMRSQRSIHRSLNDPGCMLELTVDIPPTQVKRQTSTADSIDLLVFATLLSIPSSRKVDRFADTELKALLLGDITVQAQRDQSLFLPVTLQMRIQST